MKMQYAKMDGDVLMPVGESIPRLPAGFYNVVGMGGHGYGIAPANPVSDDLIDIPGTPADEINVDIQKFLAVKGRYIKTGLTHKRGYLFYGPPGTGKTSLGLMIARRFIRDADGVVFHIPNSGVLHIAVELIRQVEEPGRPTMFLMEEADGFLNDTRALSILDGEHSLAGAVFVAMTNYKERMAPRIANRPGRFDRVTYIGAPPHAVQVEYLNRLLVRLGEDHPDAPEKIAGALDGLTISMAHLREAFISHVLMGFPTEQVRARFEEMAGPTKTEDAEDDDEDDDDEECYSCQSSLNDDGECTNSSCDVSPYYDSDNE